MSSKAMYRAWPNVDINSDFKKAMQPDTEHRMWHYN